jgi:hypothetical protein
MKITTILLVLVSSLFLITFISAEQFNSTILDESQAIYSTPAVAIDSDGVKHIVYSLGDSLVYINSLDNFEDKIIISDSLGSYNNPVIAIDSGVIYLAFGTTCGGSTYYTNSNDWNNLIELDMNSCDEDLDILIDDTETLFIAGQKDFGGNDYDIILASSTDFTNFNYQRIQKPARQVNPHIALDSGNNIHLVYYDWSDGIALEKGEMTGQYKTRYRNSIDNFVSEESISNANQSYGADIAIDSNDNVWVTYKSTEFSEVEGEPFTYGDIFLADRNSNWTSERITAESTFYLLNRPTSIIIDEINAKHFTWSEWKDVSQENESIYVMYGRHNSPTTTTLEDISFEEQLGWAAISIDSNGNPYIVANIHSLADYSLLEETPQLSLQDLQDQIDELNNSLLQLENRVSFLEEVINNMKIYFSDFWSYFLSEDKCLNSETQCLGNAVQQCVNHEWVDGNVCANGCTNGECNKEDCTTKPNEYFCLGTYSKYTDYYGCKAGQGTATACNFGQCSSYVRTGRYCGYNKCNPLNGLCK